MSNQIYLSSEINEKVYDKIVERSITEMNEVISDLMLNNKYLNIRMTLIEPLTEALQLIPKLENEKDIELGKQMQNIALKAERNLSFIKETELQVIYMQSLKTIDSIYLTRMQPDYFGSRIQVLMSVWTTEILNKHNLEIEVGQSLIDAMIEHIVEVINRSEFLYPEIKEELIKTRDHFYQVSISKGYDEMSRNLMLLEIMNKVNYLTSFAYTPTMDIYNYYNTILVPICQLNKIIEDTVKLETIMGRVLDGRVAKEETVEGSKIGNLSTETVRTLIKLLEEELVTHASEKDYVEFLHFSLTELRQFK